MNIVGISGLHNSVMFKQQILPNLTERQYRIVQGLDSAAALVTSEGIQAAAAEERFSRKKGTGAFPIGAIRYCLDAGSLTLKAVDYIAHGFSYEPVRELFEKQDHTRQQFEEVFSRQVLLRWLDEYLGAGSWDDRLIQVPHHIAHAASTFYPSGFEEALILVADGMGEIHSTTVAVGRGNEMAVVKQLPALHSLGLLYGVFTLYLGFYMNLDEYKVMGLAPYGDPRRYFDRVMELVHLKADGGYTIPILHENVTLEDKETYGGTLRSLADRFGPSREPEAEISDRHRDLAAALQAVLESALLHILRHFKRQTGQRNLCLAGGVALNCSANGVIRRSRIFDKVFVQPAAGDDGTALGAALYAQRLHQPQALLQPMQLPFWGPEYDNEAITGALTGQLDLKSRLFTSFDDLIAEVTKRLANKQIIGWFQGRMEFGPRALGSRSILADPRDPTMRGRINRIVKKREEFRPFAPAVIEEAAVDFFDIQRGDERTYAAMLFVAPVRPAYRGELPAITHVDNSARLQVVSKLDNPRFWQVLHEFGQLTGLPILLNTSFNVRGQPIVCSPAEAIDTFLATDLDALVIGDFLVTRR